MKIFVQGDRDARDCAGAAAALAKRFAEKGTHLNLGAYGKLVDIFTKAGCKAICHAHREGRGLCPPDIDLIDYQAVIRASGLGDKKSIEWFAWAVRLAELIESSDAAIFFPGREGTLAHLFPFLVLAIKGKKKVALVGWPHRKVDAIRELVGLNSDDKNIVFFDHNDIDNIVQFVTT